MIRSARLLGLALVLVFAGAHASDEVAVQGAWVREAPPGASVMAAYMTLVGTASSTKTLVAAKAAGFASVELHETVFESGGVAMRPLTALAIPPRERIVLAPGGRHLMLIKPQRAFGEGSQVVLELKFADGAVMRLDVPVKRALADEAHHHH